MRFRNSFPALLLVVAAACATAPESQDRVQLRDLTIGDTEIDLLADLMRREDNRQFDSAAFHGFLSSTSQVVRPYAVRALGRIGNRDAASLVLRALADTDAQLRAEAAFALGELGDSSAVVVEALGRVAARSGVDAAEAVDALGKLRTESARLHVERALGPDRTSDVTQAALLSIYRFPRRAPSTQLIVNHTNSNNAETRWRATYALTRTPAQPTVVRRLLDLLRTDQDTWTASFAARGLRAATVDSAGLRAQAQALLLARVNDPRAPVRINSITALTGYRDSTLLPQLLPLLNHQDPNTRVAVAQVIGATGARSAVPTLTSKTLDGGERPVVRGAALNALVAIDPPVALTLVTRLAAESNWLSRLYAVRALAGANSGAALPFLRQLAHDRDPRVVTAAIETAASARDTLPAARALFIETLASADPFVRAAALSGLERYADPADQILLFDSYARAHRDTVPEAAVAALDAIARLVQKNAAVDRAFRVRFPFGSECPHPDVRRALQRHFQVQDSCGVSATSRVYERVVRDLLVPSLKGTNPRARITTAGTTIEIELLAADAPLTVRNFIDLATRNYFNGSRWHRVVPNFVIQDGDPFGSGSGGPGYAIRDEMNRVRYGAGAVGMALSGPDTGGSQFFITHSPQPHLDGGYTVFGRVLGPLSDAFYRIAQDDVIESVQIVR